MTKEKGMGKKKAIVAAAWGAAVYAAEERNGL
jgi:hypothetical protein